MCIHVDSVKQLCKICAIYFKLGTVHDIANSIKDTWVLLIIK